MQIRYETQGAIGYLTIEGKGPHNLLSQGLVAELAAGFRRVDDDPAVRAAIITSVGPHFSAGIDTEGLREFLATEPPETLLAHYWNPGEAVGKPVTIGDSALFRRRTVKPVVAAIRGRCLNDALALVGLHTDIRIAGVSARFGFPAMRYGLGGAFAIRSRLARQIPRTALLWILETGQELDAAGALRCFLVNEVVADDEVLARARVIASAITELAPHVALAEKLSLLRLEEGRGQVDEG